LSNLAQDTPNAIRLQERIAVFLLGFSAFLPLYAPQSVLPQLAADFGTTPAAAGAVIGATTLAVALSAPAAGPLTDRFGRKRAMLTAIFLLVPLTLLLTLCRDLSQLLAVRFSQGIALPALFTGAVAYIATRWSGPQAAAMTGLFVSGSAMGGFAGRFVAGLLAEFISWQSGFTALAVISALCALVVLLWLPADQGRAVDGIAAHVAGMRRHLANPRIRAVCAFGSTVLFSMTATLSYVGFHLADPPFLLTASGIGLVFLVYPISASAAPFNGRLIQRFGGRGAFLAALSVCFSGANGAAVALSRRRHRGRRRLHRRDLPVPVHGAGLCRANRPGEQGRGGGPLCLLLLSGGQPGGGFARFVLGVGGLARLRRPGLRRVGAGRAGVAFHARSAPPSLIGAA
jgi:MFS transporter, YNFM family, putative membrane transport protein